MTHNPIRRPRGAPILPRGWPCALAVALAAPAVAATPAEVFRQAQHSVLVLEILDAEARPAAALTAVVVAAGRAVSPCDAIDGAPGLRISLDTGALPARVEARDRRHNLCLLAVPGLDRPPLPAGAAAADLPPGTRVLAVANALGLGMGITEGVVSGLRKEAGSDYIQHTAPVSPGSEGGALLDGQGRLLGVILYQSRDGQNVNFAVPARWLAGIGAADISDRAYEARQERARSLQGSAQWDALAAHARDWSRAEPGEAAPWHWLALAAERLDDADAAEAAWRSLRRLQPGSVSAGIGLAHVLLQRGKHAEALELARGLLVLRREDAEVWTLVGAAEQAAGSAERAGEAYERALAFNPWWLEAHLGLIRLTEGRRDFAAAAVAWRRLTDLYPDDAGIRSRRVRADIRAGRPAQAYVFLERLGGTAAQAADTWFLKGLTLAALGRPLAATQAYRRSLAAGPDNPAEVQAALGVAYRELGRFPEAIAALREALRLEPRQDEWRYHLIIALKDGGHAAEAVELTHELAGRHAKDAVVWRQMGFALAILGRPADSIPALERSLELNPRQAKVWSALAEVYHAAGRPDDVRRVYEKLRGIDAARAEQVYRAQLLPYEEAAR